MDCFYAAVEEREDPSLVGKPIAVGGGSKRGVLTTANYEARKFGCRSAMPGWKAKELCPKLIILPVQFDLYRAESKRIRQVFEEFSDLVEPLSLDEAYLDVSHLRSQAFSIAAEIRARIFENTRLTASAGIASNKFLAKIASDWEKPNGQFEIQAEEIGEFVQQLPVRKIWGVGKRTAEKLERFGLKTCGDVQKWPLNQLTREFGSFGVGLYQLSRGEDDRQVNPDRERKSLSNERTFFDDLDSLESCAEALARIVAELDEDYRSKSSDRRIAKSFIKLKFNDFKTTTAERSATEIRIDAYDELLAEAWSRREGRTVRLIGAGVRFAAIRSEAQLEML
ncbi:MAG: DNA polymerase-4 [Verrucomicrobiales bacterium]|jgi:DNA polymerase-4